MKKGRFSLILSLVFLFLGLTLVALGIFSGLGLLPLDISNIVLKLSTYLSVSKDTPYAISECGIFFIIEALIILCCRKRSPYSLFLAFFSFPIYLTLYSAYRVYNNIALPSFFPSSIRRAHPGLLYCLFVLEILLSMALLSALKAPNEKWRKKRDIRIKMLEAEGAIKSKETLENEKLLKRQQKLNEEELRKRARDEKKYALELEKSEKSEEKKRLKEEKKEKERYERVREKEERRREQEEKKALKKSDIERDRVLEKYEREEDKRKSKLKKEEKKRRKLSEQLEREQEKERKREESESFDIGPIPEYERGLGNPDTPLSFPDFEPLTNIKARREERIDEKKIAEPPQNRFIENNSVLDSLSEELEKEESLKQKEDKLNTKRFSKGGMLEATLEMLNSDGKVENTIRPTSPIIGLDDEDDKESEGEGEYNSVAPSTLSKDHPRYKMFTSLKEERVIEKEREDETEQGIAPSNLSKDHPRYKMFMNLKEDNTSTKSVDIKGKEREGDSSIAPSTLSKDHPRYKMFESLQKNEDESKTVVSYTPGRSFIPTDTTVASHSYSSLSKIEEVKKEEIENPIYEEEREERIEKVEKDYAPSIPFDRVRSVTVDEGGHKTIEIKSEEEALDDFNLLVGVGDLASNRAGMTAIKMRQNTVYSYPSPSLLVDYPAVSQEIDPVTRRNGEIIVQTLAEQRVVVELSDIIKGPTVTMYELKLAQGMVISKIKSREDELNYALGGKRVRILAPVPGKQAVGIEVPNEKTSIVGFKDMIYELRANEKYKAMSVPMILGRTVTGFPVVIDVAKMPHLIIAGTTGSGKSVCINSFVDTIIYQKGPREVRLIMVDPKVVELSVYNGIPHLLTPVITDAQKAIKALNWLVSEMERRYSMLAKYGVRNIAGLNEKIDKKELADVEHVPYIVLIMDEFADIMAVVKNEMDTAISRIAAKARAAGIHLVLATQRPSSDVILGTLKSNLPGRIAFAVSSGINSRVILDEQGAENLLGRGDMLLLDPSVMGLQRIQGALISDSEVENVAKYIKENNAKAEFLDDEVFASDEEGDSGDEEWFEDSGDDNLYEAAKRIVFERKSASASYLQRRLKIGYNRAARIVEMMEEEGIVGPANGSKPREILRFE